MKNCTTLFLALFSLVAFGQYQSPVGHLTVFAESGDAFFMYLNGELQNDTPQTNIRIEDLDQKFYNVKIKFVDKTLKEISKNYVSVMNNDGFYEDVTYKIKVDKNKKTRMNYFSSIPVVQNYQAPQDVYVIHGSPNGQTPPLVNNGVSIGGINISINSPNSNNNQGLNENNNNQAIYNSSKGCEGKYEMRPSDFENAKRIIAKETFQDARRKVMFQMIENNCLSTFQIEQLMKLYSFDDERMKVAKFAFDYCVDPKNYYTLNNLFSFDSAKNELIDYTQSKANRR